MDRGPTYFVSEEMLATFYGPVSPYRVQLQSPKFIDEHEWARFDSHRLRFDPTPIAELKAEGHDSVVWIKGSILVVFVLDGLSVASKI